VVVALPSSRSVVWSAFRAGSLVAFGSRPASWSPPVSWSRGAPVAVRVAVLSFRCPVRAGCFAARWAARLGRSVRVRRSACGRFWSVSVPVAGIPGVARWVWVAGGAPSPSGGSVVGGLRGLCCGLGLLSRGRGFRFPGLA
jgi:hypothetical protein